MGKANLKIVLIKMYKEFSLCWVVALKAEAKEIINQYKLYSFDHEGPFPIYKNKDQDIWLTISGIGQVNSAAACMFLFLKSNVPPWSIWVNIGIAGFEEKIGGLFKIDKIISDSNKYNYYPSRVTKNKIPSATLLTVDKAQTNYSKEYMVDMEGSAFFQTVSKITSHELIVIIKIVSDNSKNKLENINSGKIENLFKNNFSSIKECLLEYLKLSQDEYKRKRLTIEYYELISLFNFSETQKHLLKDLTKKWASIFPNKNLIEVIKKCNEGKSAIEKLKYLINENVIDWGKN